MKKHIFTLFIGCIGGILGAFIYDLNTSSSVSSTKSLNPKSQHVGLETERGARAETGPSTKAQTRRSLRGLDNTLSNALPDLKQAAKTSIERVLYIRNVQEGASVSNPFAWFFGEPGSNDRVSSGSGVIFRADGYIVTNWHVVEGADLIEVVYRKRVYEATLVGADPSTDLAVIKVENEENWPSFALGDEEQLAVGQWVLAVGNPFNLTSTVTAGIVSAKGRNIRLLTDNFPIESYIQTDAAINPGNSGGALVDATGKLVGINTAIVSKTGSYAGYSFAVPISIVAKVVGDLILHKEVQRAYTGMILEEITESVAKNLGLKSLSGILIQGVQEEGAAQQAGIKEKDVLLSIGGHRVESRADVEERVVLASPGDVLELQILRKGVKKDLSIQLLNKEGTTSIVKRNRYYSKKWGIELESVSKLEKQLYGIRHGVKLVGAESKFFKQRFPRNFIITHINRRAVNSPKETEKILSSLKGRVFFEGVTEKGRRRVVEGYLH